MGPSDCTSTCSSARLYSTFIFKFADAPWSYDCRKLLPIWDKLGEQYENHKDIIIAKIDVTANDILSVAVDRYPFFTLFPAGPDYQVRSCWGRMWRHQGGCVWVGVCLHAWMSQWERSPLSKKALVFIYSTLDSLPSRTYIREETLLSSSMREAVARAHVSFTDLDLQVITALHSAV